MTARTAPSWAEVLCAHAGAGVPAVLVTVAAVRGSAPRDAGARMIVTAEGATGSVGGGTLELECIRHARALLADAPTMQERGAVSDALRSATGEGLASEAPPLPFVAPASPVAPLTGQPFAELVRFPLGPGTQQCCGGAVRVLFERIGRDDGEWCVPLARAIRERWRAVRVSGVEGPCRGRRFVVIVAKSDEASGEGVPEALARSHGSLGEARLDAVARRLCGAVLARAPSAPVTQLRPIGPRAAGNVVLLEAVEPAGFALLLFGAGHVGRALVRVLEDVECRITWVDTRADAFPPHAPDHVRMVRTDAPEREIDRAAAGSMVLVMTHSHPLDFELVERALRHEDLGYVGLIGSHPKRNRFVAGLAAEGLEPRSIARLRCPIGIPGIHGKEPAAIAIAVAAELLQIHEAASATLPAPAASDTPATSGSPTASGSSAAPGSSAASGSPKASAGQQRAEPARRERARRALERLAAPNRTTIEGDG